MRAAGGAYLACQACLLVTQLGSPAWWGPFALTIAVSFVAQGLLSARLAGISSWPRVTACVMAAGAGWLAGAALSMPLTPLFFGPLVLVWSALAWLAAGWAAATRRLSPWARRLASCAVAGGGIVGTLMLIAGELPPALDVERYSLALGSVHPMLLGGAIACHLLTRRHGREGGD